MKLYCGNLSYDASEEDLRKIFSEYGEVSSVTIVSDKFTGESRGFGFVEMPDNNAAQSAMDSLNGQDFHGRSLTVNEARPRPERSGGGGGFGGGGGGGGRDRRPGPGGPPRGGDRGGRGGFRGGR